MKLVAPLLIYLAACGGDPVRHIPDAPAMADANGIVGPGDGLVWLTQRTLPSPGSSVQVVFYQTFPSPPTSTDGPCVYTHLVAGQPGQDDAGDISLAGGTATVTAPSTHDGNYSVTNLPPQLFSGGETITAHATGATVPAFDLTATAPALATLTQPATFASVTVDHTMPLTIAWTGGGTQDIGFIAYSESAAAQVYCRFPAAPGTAEIPVAALAHLATPGSSTYAIFSNSHATTTNAWGTIELSLILPAVQDGAEVNGSLKLQ